MKKYIGTLKVMAEPMTYGEAFKDGVIPSDCYREEFDNEAGYKVVSEDGSTDWIPKDYFDATFKVAETHVDRMNLEYDELLEKNGKLYGFIKSDKFAECSLGVKALLIAQDKAMVDYMGLLGARTTIMETGEGGMGLFSFGVAIILLKNGFSVRREGWNGKGLMVFKQVPAHITSNIIPTMQSLPEEAKRLILAHGDHIDYECQCLIFDPQTGKANSWVPSISDIFATDWELVIE